MAETQSLVPPNDFPQATVDMTNASSDTSIVLNNKDNAMNTVHTETESQQPLLSGNDTDELPLQFRWALWYSAPRDIESENNKKWDQERVKQIIEFGTVEEFWRVFNNLSAPSNLQDGADLHLFRSGVSPAWEDPFNSKGGTWTCRLSKDDGTNKVDTTWFNSVLTMIGDNFDDADDICGLVVSVRSKTNRIQLWVRHADDREAVRRIGKQFKDVNRIKQQTKIVFYSHDDQKDYAKPNKPSEMVL